MASLPSGPETVYVGMDTAMQEIVCGVLRPGREVPAAGRVPDDEESVRRLTGKPGDWRLLPVCYEAGPSGYELHRLITSMGVACAVIEPSLVPKGASDRERDSRAAATAFHARYFSRPPCWLISREITDSLRSIESAISLFSRPCAIAPGRARYPHDPRLSADVALLR
jgi:transposase